MRELPEERLDSLVSLITDKTTGQKDATRPYLGLEHLPSGGSSVLGMRPAEDSVSINNMFQAGDILFGKLRPRLRKSVRVQFDGYCSTDILVLRAKGDAHSPFAGFVLQSDAVFSEAIRTEEGTKMPRCAWGMLRKLRVFCPDNSSQRSIAEVLSTLDLAIEQAEALIAKTQQIKAGLTHDLFTRGVTPDGRLRPSREVAPRLYKESPLGWIPKEWTFDRYRDVCDRVSVGIATSTTAHFVERGVPMLRNQNIREGRLDLSEVIQVSHEFDAINKSKRLRTGDVVTVRTGYPGVSAVVPGALAGWQTFTTLISTPNPQRAIPAFLCSVLNSHVGKRQIARLQGGGAQQNLNVGWISKLMFPCPTLAEQQAITDILAAMSAEASLQESEVVKFHGIKRGLMQDLLTGRVRVPVAEAPRVEAGV